MPPVIIAAAVAGTAALAGAAVTSNATNNAADASQKATDQSIALQQQQYNQTRADEAPYTQAGYGAVNALTGRLLGPTAAAPVTGAITNANQMSAGANGGTGQLSPDQLQALLQARPDVMAEYQRASAAGDPNSPAYAAAGLGSPEAYAQHWYSNMGGSSSYQLPGSAAAPAATAATDPAAPSASYYGTATPVAGTVTAPKTGASTVPAQPGTSGPVTGGSYDPNQFLGSTNALTGAQTPAQLTGNPQSYGNSGNPTFTDPGFTAPTAPTTAPFSFTGADYTASPGYQYAVDQAMKAVQGSAAAGGSLQSGATLKALQSNAVNLANQDFNQERTAAQGIYQQNYTNQYGAYQDQRNYDTANYDTNRAFAYQNYADGRNYLTGQANTQTGNLFNLANMGQSAASQTANAGANTTNGIVNSLTGNAGTQANAGLAGASSINSLLGSGVNAMAYAQRYGSNPLTVQAPTLTQAVQQGAAANPLLF